MHGLAFLQQFEILGHVPALPGAHVEPHGLDDGVPVTALVDVVGCHGQVCALPVLEVGDSYIPDLPFDFDAVDLFHNLKI